MKDRARYIYEAPTGLSAYFAYFQSNSFVGSLLFDLEFVRNCRNKTGHLPGIPHVALTSAALKQSAVSL